MAKAKKVNLDDVKESVREVHALSQQYIKGAKDSQAARTKVYECIARCLEDAERDDSSTNEDTDESDEEDDESDEEDDESDEEDDEGSSGDNEQSGAEESDDSADEVKPKKKAKVTFRLSEATPIEQPSKKSLSRTLQDTVKGKVLSRPYSTKLIPSLTAGNKRKRGGKHTKASKKGRGKKTGAKSVK